MSAERETDLYYEVVRLIGRKVLFLPEHLERLQASLSGSGLSYPGNEKVLAKLASLVGRSNQSEGNIRITLQESDETGVLLDAEFVPHFYPDRLMYEKGVDLILYPHLRSNPGIKKWDGDFRTSVRKAIENSGAYEAALVNPFGEITEGSRSNLFFISEDDQILGPPTKDILAGITRKYVLELCQREGIPVSEKKISVTQLGHLKACFLSGTSPIILPVKQLDRYSWAVDHPLVRKIMKEFEQILNTHLTEL